MDAQIKHPAVGDRQPTDAPGQPAGTSLIDELEDVGNLLSDTVQLAALEARRAVGSAATVLLLMLLAAFGATMAAMTALIALAFALQSLGLSWALALLAVAAIAAALCFVAVLGAQRLAYRFTLPTTRRALSAKPGEHL